MTVFVVTVSFWCDEYEHTAQEIIGVCSSQELALKLIEATKKDKWRVLGKDVDFEEFTLDGSVNP